MDMARERVVDGEMHPGRDEEDGEVGGGAHGGGHGPWGQRPLAPSSSLEMVLLWRLISPSRRLPRGRNFRSALDLGFLSLYRLLDSRHPDYVFCISGFLEASELGWAEFMSKS